MRGLVVHEPRDLNETLPVNSVSDDERIIAPRKLSEGSVNVEFVEREYLRLDPFRSIFKTPIPVCETPQSSKQ